MLAWWAMARRDRDGKVEQTSPYESKFFGSRNRTLASLEDVVKKQRDRDYVHDKKPSPKSIECRPRADDTENVRRYFEGKWRKPPQVRIENGHYYLVVYDWLAPSPSAAKAQEMIANTELVDDPPPHHELSATTALLHEVSQQPDDITGMDVDDGSSHFAPSSRRRSQNSRTTLNNGRASTKLVGNKRFLSHDSRTPPKKKQKVEPSGSRMRAQEPDALMAQP